MALLIVTFVAEKTIVSGNSMAPTLVNSQQLITEKVSYHFGKPKRFDIIVFDYEHARNTFYVKRIIALPGERVRIDDAGCIYINDKALAENFGGSSFTEPGLAENEIILGKDEYFVLGDNREDSIDSRFYEVKNIKADRIVGRVCMRIWPFSLF